MENTALLYTEPAFKGRALKYGTLRHMSSFYSIMYDILHFVFEQYHSLLVHVPKRINSVYNN